MGYRAAGSRGFEVSRFGMTRNDFRTLLFGTCLSSFRTRTWGGSCPFDLFDVSGFEKVTGASECEPALSEAEGSRRLGGGTAAFSRGRDLRLEINISVWRCTSPFGDAHLRFGDAHLRLEMHISVWRCISPFGDAHLRFGDAHLRLEMHISVLEIDISVWRSTSPFGRCTSPFGDRHLRLEIRDLCPADHYLFPLGQALYGAVSISRSMVCRCFEKASHWPAPDRIIAPSLPC